MRLTPRAAEVKAIVELLESEGYDSAEALAKDVIKRVGEIFAERDWYAYAYRLGGADGITVLWGPLSSHNEMKKFADRLALQGEDGIFKLASTAEMLRHVAESEGGVPNPAAQTCLDCGHPGGAHLHERRVGKCQMDRCRCTSLITKPTD